MTRPRSHFARYACRLIRDLQDQRGWSNQKLADMAGLSHSTVNDIHAGKQTPGLDTYEALIRALGYVPVIEVRRDMSIRPPRKKDNT